MLHEQGWVERRHRVTNGGGRANYEIARFEEERGGALERRREEIKTFLVNQGENSASVLEWRFIQTAAIGTRRPEKGGGEKHINA